MYFGYGAPTRPPLGTAANTRVIAQKAEEVGLSYVSIADHIFPPSDEKDAYPYTADGSTPWDGSGNVLECLTLATYIAGVTGKLRLVTGVMVVPLRNPLVTAKVLASIDVLSEGRLVVGCGAGWGRTRSAGDGKASLRDEGVTDPYGFRTCVRVESPRTGSRPTRRFPRKPRGGHQTTISRRQPLHARPRERRLRWDRGSETGPTSLRPRVGRPLGQANVLWGRRAWSPRRTR